MTTTPTVASATTGTWRPALVPAALLAAGGLALFGLEQRPLGLGLLAVTLLTAWWVGRRAGHQSLLRDLSLVVGGVLVMNLVPITTDISWLHMLTMGTAMVVAVAGPYLVSRYVYRERAIRFPWRSGRWTRFEKVWLVVVVALGYAILPVYMIRTGVYQNWPAVDDVGGVLRLFAGTNALGVWDELFFICTTFTLLRRHLPDWQANALQAVLFTSFLHELGFESIGPLLIYPFALVQGWTFKVTQSLAYVVTVHLTFDLVLFGVLLHAHQPTWVDIFIY